MVATAVYISSTPSEDCAARGEQDFLVDKQPKNGKVQWLWEWECLYFRNMVAKMTLKVSQGHRYWCYSIEHI